MLKRMKAALWFIIEPLMVRNEAYSFGFYKALIEKVKNHRDALDPENDSVNRVNNFFPQARSKYAGSPHLYLILFVLAENCLVLENPGY